MNTPLHLERILDEADRGCLVSRAMGGGQLDNGHSVPEEDGGRAKRKAEKQVDRMLDFIADPLHLARLEHRALNGGPLPRSPERTADGYRERKEAISEWRGERGAIAFFQRRSSTRSLLGAYRKSTMRMSWSERDCTNEADNARGTPHPTATTPPSPCPSPPPSARSSRESTPMDLDYAPDTVLDEIFGAGGSSRGSPCPPVPEEVPLRSLPWSGHSPSTRQTFSGEVSTRVTPFAIRLPGVSTRPQGLFAVVPF